MKQMGEIPRSVDVGPDESQEMFEGEVLETEESSPVSRVRDALGRSARNVGNALRDGVSKLTGGSMGGGGAAAGAGGGGAAGGAAAAGGAGGGAMAAASSAVNGVARFFNVGPTAAKLMLAGVLAGTCGIGGAAAYASYSPVVSQQLLYVGKDDCTQRYQQAQKNYGYGEREIPELTSGNYPTGYVTTWENHSDAISWTSGTGQSKVHEWWVDNGRQTDKAFEKVGDYYIVAVAPAAFGKDESGQANVGDWITFYFSDGESFEVVVGDTKGNADDFPNRPDDLDNIIAGVDGYGHEYHVNGWGHIYGDGGSDSYCNVLEFWGLDSMNDHFKRMGHEGDRVVSFTNHGTAPELGSIIGAGTDGAEGAAAAGADSARKKGASGAAGTCYVCEKKSSIDNSSIATTALSIAYSTQVSGTKGTKAWQAAYEKIFPGDGYYASCDRTVGTVMRLSGADSDYPAGACAGQWSYIMLHLKGMSGVPESDAKYEMVSDWKPGDSTDSSDSKLQPGDIFLYYGEHTSLYVGTDLVKEWHFTGDAFTGTPEDGAYSVSGSLSDRAPGVGKDDGRTHQGSYITKPSDAKGPGQSAVFRFIGTPSKEASSSDLQVPSITLDSECEDKKDDGSIGEKLARRAAELSYSRDCKATDGYFGTEEYKAAYLKAGYHKHVRTTIPPNFGVNNNWGGYQVACSAFIGTVVRDVGADEDFSDQTIEEARMWGYYEGETSPDGVWRCVGKYEDGMDLMPGDIIYGHDGSGYDDNDLHGHILMYVGPEIIKSVYESSLKGTEADLGEPVTDAVFCAAHRMTLRPPSMSTAKQAGVGSCKGYSPEGAKVYRCVNPDNDDMNQEGLKNEGAADTSSVVGRARAAIGRPYAWGAVGPGSYDCSGLVSYAVSGKHSRLGNTLTFMGWQKVSASDAKPGDICTSDYHCGVYIGNGKMIHAPTFGQNVQEGSVMSDMIYVRPPSNLVG